MRSETEQGITCPDSIVVETQGSGRSRRLTKETKQEIGRVWKAVEADNGGSEADTLTVQRGVMAIIGNHLEEPGLNSLISSSLEMRARNRDKKDVKNENGSENPWAYLPMDSNDESLNRAVLTIKGRLRRKYVGNKGDTNLIQHMHDKEEDELEEEVNGILWRQRDQTETIQVGYLLNQADRFMAGHPPGSLSASNESEKSSKKREITRGLSESYIRVVQCALYVVGVINIIFPKPVVVSDIVDVSNDERHISTQSVGSVQEAGVVPTKEGLKNEREMGKEADLKPVEIVEVKSPEEAIVVKRTEEMAAGALDFSKSAEWLIPGSKEFVSDPMVRRNYEETQLYWQKLLQWGNFSDAMVVDRGIWVKVVNGKDQMIKDDIEVIYCHSMSTNLPCDGLREAVVGQKIIVKQLNELGKEIVTVFEIVEQKTVSRKDLAKSTQIPDTGVQVRVDKLLDNEKIDVAMVTCTGKDVYIPEIKRFDYEQRIILGLKMISQGDEEPEGQQVLWKQILGSISPN
jgi:hypothetical protein